MSDISRDEFTRLIRANSRLVWAQLQGMVRDPAWVEDLCQETFLRAWRSIGTLKDDASFRPWLLSIARRLCWDFAARENRRAEIERRADPPCETAEDRAEGVRAALADLPEKYRLPLALRYIEGLSHAEIRDSLGLGDGELRGLLARGTKLLRATIPPEVVHDA